MNIPGLKRLPAALKWTALVFFLLICGSLLALRSDAVSTKIGQAVVGFISSDSLLLEVAGVRGSWIGGLELYGVRAASVPGPSQGEGWSVTADTLTVRYRLLPLLRKTLVVEGMRGSGVSLDLAFRSDGSSEEAATSVDDSNRSPWALRLDSVALSRGSLRLRRSSSSSGDGQEIQEDWWLRKAYAAAHNVRIGSSVTGVLDSLAGDFQPPGVSDEGWGKIQGSGELGNGRMRVAFLRLQSPESDLRAQGTIPLAFEALAPEGLDAQLTANPLHIRDVRPFLPLTIPDSIRLDLEASLRSVGDSLRLDLEGDGNVRGHVRVQAQRWGGSPGSVMDARITVDGLDLQGLGLAPSPAELDATLDARLLGDPMDVRGSGSLSVDLRDPSAPLERRFTLAASSDSASGPWTAEWHGVHPELNARGNASLSAGDGRVWSVDGIVAYRGKTKEVAPPDSVNSASRLPFWVPSRAWGNVRMSGSGFSLDSATAMAHIGVDSATVGAARVGPLSLEGELRSGEVNVSLKGAVAGGRVEAQASGNVIARTGQVTEARLVEVDVASLLGDSVSSRLSATAQGRLVSASPLRASGSVVLLPSRYGRWSIDSGSARAEVQDGRTNFFVQASLPDSGRAATSGQFEQARDGARVRVDSLRFAHMDLRSLLGAADTASIPNTDLNGHGNGTVAREAAEWTGAFTVQVDSSRVGVQDLTGGRLDLEVDSTGAVLKAELTTPQGGLQGEARLVPAPPGDALSVDPHRPRSLVIPGIQFRNLDPAAFRGRPGPGQSYSGSLSGQVALGTLEELTGEARIELDTTSLFGFTLDEAGLDMTAVAGQLEGNLEAAGPWGRIQAEGATDLSLEVPTYSGSATVRFSGPEGGAPSVGPGGGSESPVPGSLRGPETTRFLQARVQLDGQGFDPELANANATLEVDSAQWEGIPLDEGRVVVALADGSLKLDTLVFGSPAGTLQGSGVLPVRGSSGSVGKMTFNVEILQADPLANLLNTEILALDRATAAVTMEGALDDLRIQGDGQVTALLYNEIRIQGLDLQAQVHRTRADGLAEGTARLHVDRMRLPFAPVRSLDVDVSLAEADELGVEASAVIDDLRDARLTARVEQIAAPSALRLEAFEFRADQDLWVLAHETRIDFKDGLEIDSLLVTAGDQEIRAGGRLAAYGPLTFHAAVSQLDLETVADLLGYPNLRGQIGGSLRLSGTGDAPGGRAEVSGTLEPPAASPGDLSLEADLQDKLLNFQGGIVLEGRNRARVQGVLPMDLSLADSIPGLVGGETMRVDASADSLPLAWFDPFLTATPVRDLKGTVLGSIQIRGTPDDPQLGGHLDLIAGSVRVPELGIQIKKGHGRLALDGDVVRLDSLRIRSGDGWLRASGSAVMSGLDRSEYQATIRAQTFQGVDRRDMNATLSGEMDLTGTRSSLDVTGQVEIVEGDLYLGDMVGAPDVEPVVLTEEDYQELARVFGYRRPGSAGRPVNLWDSTSVDLDVRIGRNSWVRQRSNPELAMQFEGELSVEKNSGETLRLLGRLEGVPGRSYVQQFGRRFTLAQGILNFRGDPASTQVDIEAQYEVPSRDNPDAPEVTISLDLSGTPGDLALELSSTPSLEASDIVSYLAVGRPAGQILGGQRGEGEGSTSLTGAGEALALGQLSAAVETYAREQVGLDVVEITTDGLEGVTLLAGRYLSPELYLGIRQPLSFQRSEGEASQRTPDPEVEVELEAVRWLLLNLQAGGRTGVEFFVRSRIAYD